MENKQTAVEYAEYELIKLNSALGNMEITPLQYLDKKISIWDEARRMQTEQIKKGFFQGWINGDIKEDLVDSYSEKYYKDMYEK